MSDSERNAIVDRNDENALRNCNLFENVLNVVNGEFIEDPDEFTPHEDNYTSINLIDNHNTATMNSLYQRFLNCGPRPPGDP